MPPEVTGERLDRFVADRLSDHSRSRVAAWIRDGRVRVDGAPGRPSTLVKAGQEVVVEVPPPPPVTLTPQPMELDVVHVDDELLVVEKPAGLVMHPGAGHPDGTLVNGLLHRFETLSPLGLPDRPGVVHRIDAGTSGLVVVARTEAAHNVLAAQFAAHTVERRYLALSRRSQAYTLLIILSNTSGNACDICLVKLVSISKLGMLDGGKPPDRGRSANYPA